jgi:hypothetical protein
MALLSKFIILCGSKIIVGVVWVWREHLDVSNALPRCEKVQFVSGIRNALLTACFKYHVVYYILYLQVVTIFKSETV